MESLPIITTLAQWGPIFTRPEVWRPMIEEIWRRHRLGTIVTVEPGCAGSNAVFVVNGSLVAKIAAPFWTTDVQREIETYSLLAHYPQLLTPQLVVQGTIEAEQSWLYFVMTRLPGARVGDVWPLVPPDDRRTIIAHQAQIMRAFHALPVDALTTMETRGEGWRAFVRQQIAGAADYHRRTGSLPEHLLEQVPGYLAQAMPLFPDDFRPTLIHSDLTCDHLLLAEENGHWRITGFIDFGDVQVGHVDYEWIALHLSQFDGDRALLRDFLRAYGWESVVDDRFSQRLMAYSLLHLFSDMRVFIERLGGPGQVQRLEDLETSLWELP